MVSKVRQRAIENFKPSYTTLLFKSVKLSVLASILGSFLFLCIYLGVLIISARIRGAEIVSESVSTNEMLQAMLFLLFILYWTLGFILVFLVSLLPSILAGLINVWFMRFINKSTSLTYLKGALIGMLKGGIFGIFPAAIGVQLMITFVFDPNSSKEVYQMTIEIMASGILTASIIGAWYGRRAHLLS